MSNALDGDIPTSFLFKVIFSCDLCRLAGDENFSPCPGWKPVSQSALPDSTPAISLLYNIRSLQGINSTLFEVARVPGTDTGEKPRPCTTKSNGNGRGTVAYCHGMTLNPATLSIAELHVLELNTNEQARILNHIAFVPAGVINCSIKLWLILD